MNSDFHFVPYCRESVSIPPVMRRIPLDVRQNSCPKLATFVLALGIRLLFILLNAVRKQTRVMQAAGQLAPKPEIAEIHLVMTLNHSSREARNFECSKNNPSLHLFCSRERHGARTIYTHQAARENFPVPLTTEPLTLLSQLYLELCQATGDGRGKIIAATNFST